MLAARQQLGPDYEQALIDGFVTRISQAIDERVEARLAEVRPSQINAQPGLKPARRDNSQLILALGSLGLAVPLSACSRARAPAGVDRLLGRRCRRQRRSRRLPARAQLTIRPSDGHRLSFDPAPRLGRHLIREVDGHAAAQCVLEVAAKSRQTAGNALDQEVDPAVAGGGRPPADAVDLMLIGHSPDDLAACEYQLFHATPARRRRPSK